MLAVHVESRPPSRHHINVKCHCGRALWARPDQAGETINCWSCHAAVPVPVPTAPGHWVARLLRVGARQIFEARTYTLLTIGAVLVTVALSLSHLLGVGSNAAVRKIFPTAGLWAAVASLALVMTGYGELLRRGSQGDWTPRPRIGLLARLWRALICLGVGLALVLPLILASQSDAPPRTTWLGIGIALVLCMILPLVMLGTYAQRGSVRDRLDMVLAMMRRHPGAVFATLLLLPASVILLETAVFLATELCGTFRFMVLDLYPKRSFIMSVSHMPYSVEFGCDYRMLSPWPFLSAYFGDLTRGYSLTGSIPASLTLDFSNQYDPSTMFFTPAGYVEIRMFFTLGIVVGMLSVLAIQARWLGLLSLIDVRRSRTTI